MMGEMERGRQRKKEMKRAREWEKKSVHRRSTHTVHVTVKYTLSITITIRCMTNSIKIFRWCGCVAHDCVRMSLTSTERISESQLNVIIDVSFSQYETVVVIVFVVVVYTKIEYVSPVFGLDLCVDRCDVRVPRCLSHTLSIDSCLQFALCQCAPTQSISSVYLHSSRSGRSRDAFCIHTLPFPPVLLLLHSHSFPWHVQNVQRIDVDCG